MRRKRELAGVALAAALALGFGAVAVTNASATTTLAAPAALATTAGCGKAPTLTNGTKTISSSGQNRTYILRLPANYDRNKPYKLFFGLHWLNGSANDVATGGSAGATWAFYGQQQLMNNTAILVAPQGLNAGWSNTNGRDVTLMDNILTQIQNDLCVDTSQIFAGGWSFGGAMSYALACARPNVFRAVAALSGGAMSGCSGATQPVAYLGIHGTHDSVVSYSMGQSIRDTFVRLNGCTSQTPRQPARNSYSHIITDYANCKAGYPLRWIAFDGDHTPEPVDGTPQTSGARTWTGGEIYRFFSALPSTLTSTPPVSPSVSASPSRSATPSVSPSVSPSTPVSPSASVTPSTGPTGQPGACRASYAVTGSWTGGFQGEVTVTAGSAALTGWRVSWTFAGGQSISQIWGGRNTPSGSTQNVTNESWNGAVPAGGSVKFGFLGSYTGSNPVPAALTCSVG